MGEAAEGDFLLKGFSLQGRFFRGGGTAGAGPPGDARGLAVSGGLGGGGLAALRLVCGVAGAELVLAGREGEEGPGERWGRRSAEEADGGGAGSQGPEMDGSETLLVKGWSSPSPAPPLMGGWEELWSEAEDRLSTLIAGEGEEEEG